MLAGAPAPWTWHCDSTTRASGQRRASTVRMSCHTAPVSLVTTAITAGRSGSGRLRAGVEQALGAEARLERLELQGQVAEPGRLDRAHVELVDPVGVEHVDPAVGDDPQPGPRLVRRGQPVVAEPDALELAALVLEREVGVPGARHGDPADLALDPHVAQPLVAPDRLADGPGDVATRRGSSARRSRPGRPLPAGRACVRDGPARRGRRDAGSVASQAGSAQSGGSRSVIA